ncbi:ribosomal RNA small subunit methyltransferase H [Endomicrobiia bacterium]|uniref:Ribosomal RNA small subunit methyltransferase H n=1 Tax=Endomicrobium trichonymphae TaxID=1408204 RepID=RSMH_ENDTX|nr:16S rRNA (cytosine(1402)-N(4))-methyltransferase RsmH [Candidatus Endomicrobium trichonymphae]B1GZH8.1 RecName: Full=Ribosomal RNA small subunit methyltransferase H; AltName: Full=16S rRNA m(4)C1402 methyltransferase; AltName: Full=rRNA (cytosine-N(4)-)-methyltransferase RsmH [Candidatus Endomicrobium trichonymphae]BAG13660.1 16S rRNA cytosine-methyltransferase [Candidatus Endomicrobium trichonymphae]BAV58734.1 SAM-dependent methyltransferase [Candidatus Endomicrobium trichonymphae]GHT17791.
MFHIPVMPLETSRYLIGKPGGLYVDCTFGGGGHALYLLDKFKDIKIVAFDWDEDSSKRFIEREKEFSGRVTFIRDNFKNVKKALSALNISKVDGILADIGVSSKQFGDLDRGFSFNSGTLDMRMDKRNGFEAKEVVNSYSYEDLADIFYKYGEERKSRQIASAILLRRKRGIINTASELQTVICSVKRPEGRINPATKVFQALRIFVNSELENLAVLLSDAPELLNAGGRTVIISFHSLEDRIVKQNFKRNSECGIYKILTKKVVTALKEEVKINPGSRSARIRAAEKTSV